MKNLILLLAMCLAAKFSFAKTVHPSIDDDLDFKMETDFRESERGVAAFEKVEEKKEEPLDNEKENTDKDREVASDEEVFDSTNENGIRYWKY